ncbi:MAG: polyketide cyclase [Methylophaga sp.]|nr:MAG: polyketide cyclase [Methylophaga sp.]
MKQQIRLLAIFLLTLPVVVMAATAPTRHVVEEKIVINADPAAVWEVVKDFDGIHNWHPAITATEATGGNEPGASRTITLADGNTITEELKTFSEEKQSFKYSIKNMSSVGTIDDHGETLDIPVIPVAKYVSFITVKAVDGGTEVTWKAKFTRAYGGHHEVPAELGDEVAVKAVTDIYKAGLGNLKAMLEK